MENELWKAFCGNTHTHTQTHDDYRMPRGCPLRHNQDNTVVICGDYKLAVNKEATSDI